MSPTSPPTAGAALDDLARSVLAALPTADVSDDDDRRCARLLRERLEAHLATSEAGEHLRSLRNIFGPHAQVRQLFQMMPTTTPDDWAVVARRMARVPQSYAGYTASLGEGASRGMFAAPRQVETVVGQLDEWLAGEGGSWFHAFVATAPDGTPAALQTELRSAADAAAAAASALRDHLATVYLPAAQGTPDGVGPERYRIGARMSTGADLDLAEAYAWGWDEFRRLDAEMRKEADAAAARRRPRRSDASPRREGRGGRRRRGGAHLAAEDDGHGDDRPRRHALRHRRTGAHGRGDDRPARQRRRPVLHAPVAGLLPAGAHLAARPSARPGSRCGA